MPYATIDKGSSYFNTVTYTGDGTTNQTRAITFGFKPDWAWFKARDAGQSHIWVDSVRGGTKYLVSESTNAEGTLGVAQLFTSTGMTISNDAGANSLNSSGSTKVSWGWLGSNTTASNTSGSITSTVSANTTSGFSIVSYTGNGSSGATVGHGLGVAPKMVILKVRNTTGQWRVGHISASSNFSEVLNLNLTNAKGLANSIFNSTAPTSTVFTLGNEGDANGSGNTFVAYCFADVKGYSKFGSYTGNGSADGTFIYTGFKPAFVMWKRTDTTEDWVILDTARDIFNVSGLYLLANTADAQADRRSSGGYIDIVSNGFKCRDTSAKVNASGGTYIYMAFAQNPFVSSKGLPCTAR
jgi:hypothetical protein